MDKVINYCVFLFIYLLLFIFLISITYEKKMNKLILTIFLALYALVAFMSSAFLLNLIPFFIVIINLLLIKKNKINIGYMNYFDDYTKYNFNIKNLKFKKCIKYILLSYCTTIILSIIFYIIFTLLGIKVQQQQIVNRMFQMSKYELIFTAISAVIFAPVIEEFVFRYIIFEKVLKTKMNIYLSIILSSLLFAILHYNLKSFPMIFFIGCVNCYLIDKKGYWYSVFNHSFFNLISVAGIIFLKSILN